MGDRKRVWVIGAGFSRSLGGPLLGRLLSAESYWNLAARVRDDTRDPPGTKAPKLINDAAAMAVNLYSYGDPAKHVYTSRMSKESYNSEDLWRDAEEFLDWLDTISEGSAAHVRLQQLLGSDGVAHFSGDAPDPSLKALQDAARRLVAAECAVFTVDQDRSSERWEPYRAWVNALHGNDTVVSFNYDRVLECLGFEPLLPYGDLARIVRRGSPLFLKLHGSVDWVRVPRRSGGTRDEGVSFERARDPLFVTTCEDEEIAIATPGPTKQRKSNELEQLWELAQRRLAEADEINFIGYRFPPTDAMARQELLLPIMRNGNRPLLRIVLGPDVNGHDAARVRGLLTHASARAGNLSPRLITEPLYAEDFLSVWNPED